MSVDNNQGAQLPDGVDSQVEQELAAAFENENIEELLSAPVTGDQEDESKGRGGGLKLARGRVAAVQGDDVFVDLQGIDGKHQGMVPLSQFEREPRIGSIMDFVIERHDQDQGLVILSREGAVSTGAWDQLRRGVVVEARVMTTNKGGLELEMVGGIRAFMPASQVDLHYVESLETYVGQKIRAQVYEVDHRSKRVVLSRRHMLEAERQAKQAQTWETLEVGLVCQGTISGVTEYGAFVDLGGVDGLVHVSDMSYSRIDKPADLVSVGQEVQVKVLSIDQEKQRVGLGMKQVAPDPWDGVVGSLKVGDQLSAKVVRLAEFGAFVEVGPGVEGLVPISELSWKRVRFAGDVVKEGEVIQLVVQRIEPEKHRISLSHKQAKGDPWVGAEYKYKKGSLVNATVLNATEFGAFVELEPGVEGLVHISELSDTRVQQVEDVLQVGQTPQLRVLDVDESQRRINLSLKAVDKPLDNTQSPGQYNRSEQRDHASDAAQKSKAQKKPFQPLKGGIE